MSSDDDSFEEVPEYREEDTTFSDEEPPAKKSRGKEKVWIEEHILAAIRARNLQEPPATVLKNFLHIYRNEKYGPPTISLGELNDLCNQQSVPQLDDPYSTQNAYSPRILVADASEAITNGFAAAFPGPFKRVMCWAHAIRAIDKKLEKIRDKSIRQKLRTDIMHLQLSQSEDEFDVAVELFFAKWAMQSTQETDSFTTYFKDEWIYQRKNWFEGYALGVPSTNNGLEAINLTLKSHQTLRERMPLRRFMALIIDSILPDWSKERDPVMVNCKHFSVVPTKTTVLWTDAYQWAMDTRTSMLAKRGPAGVKLYFISASTSKKEATPANISAYQQAFSGLDWVSFNDYTKMRLSLWVVHMKEDQWQNATCNCPIFLKQYICKHSLGLAIRLRKCDAPDIAQAIPLGQKRKRGRPKNATKALMRE